MVSLHKFPERRSMATTDDSKEIWRQSLAGNRRSVFALCHAVSKPNEGGWITKASFPLPPYPSDDFLKNIRGKLVLVHGLLKCQSQQCKVGCGGNDKLWNRDIVAVLNMRRIWESLERGEGRPEDLRRGGERQ